MSKNYDLKDSGHRQVFTTGAQRDRQVGKGRYDLISPIALKRLADILEKGAIKYSERNWEKGMNISRFIDSAMRHLSQYIEGRRNEDHLGQAAWNLHSALHGEEMIERGLWLKELYDIPCYINKKDMDPETKKWWDDFNQKVNKKQKPIKYSLSNDRKGLLKYFTTKNGEFKFYHIHSDEMTSSEKKIHSKLLKS